MLWKNIKSNPILPFLLCFLALNIYSRSGGTTNAMSRYATLRAMSHDASFQINKYQEWTVDWAIKDGIIFSNKAPAPMLLGLPIFFILDNLSLLTSKHENPALKKVTATPRALLSLLMQSIPYALLCWVIVLWMIAVKYNKQAILFFSITALFANTAVIFMSYYFGHAISTLFLLATAFFLIKEDFKLVGLFYGLALLSEYTAAIILLPLLISIFYINKKNFRWVKPFIIGGIFPGILWCWYHIATVGSPFAIPAQFQNPRWITISEDHELLWGMFSPPNFKILLELLIGNSRGILFTQPWVLVLIPFSLWQLFKPIGRHLKALIIFCNLSLLFLLLMNSSFNGWHGGSTSGPRYLAMIIPCFALLGAALYIQMNNIYYKILLWGSIAASLLVRALIYASTVLASQERELLPFLYKNLKNKPGYKGEIKFLIFSILFLLSLFFFHKNYPKKNNTLI